MKKLSAFLLIIILYSTTTFAAEILSVNAMDSPATALKKNLPAITTDTLLQIPRLRENLRPFQTISFEIIKEKIKPDGTWSWTDKEIVTIDFKNERIYERHIRNSEEKNSFFVTEIVVADDKAVGLKYSVKSDSFREPLLSEKKQLSAYITDAKLSVFPHTDFDFLWLYYLSRLDTSGSTSRSGVWIDAIFQPKSSPVPFSLRSGNSPNEIHVSCEGKTFIIDTRKGAITKFLNEENDEKGNLQLIPSLDVTKFHAKDGWLFPIETVFYVNGKVFSRQRINPDSLAINKKLFHSDFRLVFPAGIEVMDGINGYSYIAGRDIVNEDTKNMERDLRDLLEKAKTAPLASPNISKEGDSHK